jgi:hypothetical protein
VRDLLRSEQLRTAVAAVDLADRPEQVHLELICKLLAVAMSPGASKHSHRRMLQRGSVGIRYPHVKLALCRPVCHCFESVEVSNDAAGPGACAAEPCFQRLCGEGEEGVQPVPILTFFASPQFFAHGHAVALCRSWPPLVAAALRRMTAWLPSCPADVLRHPDLQYGSSMQWRGNSATDSSLIYLSVPGSCCRHARQHADTKCCLQKWHASAGTRDPGWLPNPIIALQSDGGQRGTCKPKLTLPAPSVEQ